MKRTFLPFLLLLALLSGCRYEDGPLVSFRSPWTRLTMHPKKITRLEMDGVDYLPMFNADFPNSTFQFTREGHWSYYIIYWSSDRFTEPVWAGMSYRSANETHIKYIGLNMYGIDFTKSHTLQYVNEETMFKYVRLLVTDTVKINNLYITPSYEVIRLTTDKFYLKNIKDAKPISPERYISFESI